MDSTDNYDGQSMQSQDDQMQCDSLPQQTNGFPVAPFDSSDALFPSNTAIGQTAIPLPPPTSYQKTQNNVPPPTSTDIDIDSLLLQQFSCLGTTDHEDLVNQFQNLMNNQMNTDSARFFLEMSNWNLQTAVGCYLDFCNFQSLPSMKIIEKTRPNEHQQGWRLKNDGTESWPNGCYLMSTSQTRRIEVPPIKPGEYCDILADLAPTQSPIMWRLCTPNGWYFGESIWMLPCGSCLAPPGLTERMAQLRASSETSSENVPQVNIVISASVNME